ncbi:MAG: CHAT domain-containing tetratricopeptide repeat protein, partial [Bacteroidota bacterium]
MNFSTRRNKNLLFLLISLTFVIINARSIVAQNSVDVNELKSIADSVYERGKASQAFELYQKAVNLQLADKKWESAVKSMIQLAQLYAGASQYDQANKWLAKAQILANDNLPGNDHLLGAILDEKGGVFQVNRQLDSAIYYYRKSLQLQIKAHGNHHENVGACYNNIAGIHFFQNNLDSCIFYIKKAIEITKEIPLDQDKYLAKYYGNLSILYRRLFNYDSAFHYSAQRIEAYKSIYGEDQKELIPAYTNHGQFYADLGDFKSALKYYHLALEIQNLFPELQRQDHADNLNNIGLIHYQMGSKELALEFYLKALTIQKEIFSNKNAAFGITYNNLSLYWSNSQDYEKAIKFAKLSIKHFEASMGTNHPFVVKGMSNLADQYVKQKQYDSAFYYFGIAESIQKQPSSKLHDNDAILAANKSELFFQIDSLKTGHAYKSKSNAIYSKLYGPKHPNIARNFYRGAKAYFQNQQLEQALLEVQKSLVANGTNFHSEKWQDNPQADDWLDQYRMISSLLLKSKILHALYKNSYDTSYLEKSFQSVFLADKIIYSVIDNHIDNRDKLKLSHAAEELYEFAIRISLDRYAKENNIKWFALAHEMIDKSKAFVLSFTLRDRRARSFAGIPEDILKEEERLQVYKNHYQSSIIAEQYSTSEDPDKLLVYQSKLFDINRSLDSLVRKMESGYADYYRLKYEQRILTLKQLQQKLSPNEAVLNYFLGSEELTLLTITSNAVDLHNFPIGVELQTSINTIINELNNPQYHKTYDPKESHTFYQNYVQPGINTLDSEINKLIVLPHKNIGLIPFEILLTEKTNQSDAFLINKYVLSYGLSATLLFSERNPDRKVKANYLGFAPSYEISTTEVIPKRNRSEKSFTALKWNQVETNEISKLLNGSAIVGHEATERAFKEQSKNSRVLHLAMHTRIHNDDPMNSSLVFHQSDDQEDSYLHVFELYDMKLNADLAVLSACETGKGSLVSGEGIVSLARGFSYAGVPSIVMSHWQTNDESTKDLMQRF